MKRVLIQALSESLRSLEAGASVGEAASRGLGLAGRATVRDVFDRDEVRAGVAGALAGRGMARYVVGCLDGDPDAALDGLAEDAVKAARLWQSKPGARR